MNDHKINFNKLIINETENKRALLCFHVELLNKHHIPKENN